MRKRRIRNICITLLFIILFVYLSIFVNSIMNGNKMAFFSYKFYIMSTDSPDSNIYSGDLIIAKSIKTEDIKEKDIIIYKNDDDIIVKKITSVDQYNGNINLYVDNENTINNESIKNAVIIGKVVKNLKGVGNIALFIQTPLGTLNVILIALCLFIIIKKIVKSEEDNSKDTTLKEIKQDNSENENKD